MVATDQQINAYALAAGFSDPHTRMVAVAISLAESSGNESATNHNTNGSTDYGLWQINSVHPDVLSTGQWSNGADNAKMAHMVYEQSGGSFRPWSTYNSGAYLIYMGRAAKVNGMTDPGAAGTPSPSTPTVSNAGFSMLTDSTFWKRVILAIAGGILLLWALMKMTGNNQLSETTKSAVSLGVKAVAL